MFLTTNKKHQLEENIIDIWLCQSDSVQDRTDYFMSALSSEEKARAERFKFDIHRNRFVLYHGFMREVLAKYLNVDPAAIEYKTGDKGKPSLSDSTCETQSLQFNLSHTQDNAMLAVTKKAEVGIDIEHIDRNTDWKGICQRFFTQPEQKALFSIETLEEQERAFYELWTRKEAYMKVLGTGLSLSPTEFTLTVPPEQPALVEHISTKYQHFDHVEFVRIDLPESCHTSCATLASSSPIRECHYYLFD